MDRAVAIALIATVMHRANQIVDAIDEQTAKQQGHEIYTDETTIVETFPRAAAILDAAIAFVAKEQEKR